MFSGPYGRMKQQQTLSVFLRRAKSRSAKHLRYLTGSQTALDAQVQTTELNLKSTQPMKPTA